jgi:hypothetical protein
VRRYHLALPMLLGLCLIAISACAQTGPRVSVAQIPQGKPGGARVWFLRGSITTNPAVQAFSPLIYANGAPVSAIPIGTAFYHDFAPGSYRFTVQTNGLPTPQATSLRLEADTVYFLDVDWVSSWTQGYPQASWNFNPNTFAILTMNPQVAQAYFPTLAYLGER